MRRKGTALLIALVLLALATALLTGASAAARASQKSQQSAETADRLKDAWRSAAFAALSNWSESQGLLAPGEHVTTTTQGANIHTTVTTTRLTARTFGIDLEVTFGPDTIVMARRRTRIIASRTQPTDTLSLGSPPKLLSRWSVADLY